MQGWSNGKGNCDSKFVLVAAPFTNPKGHIFVPWGLRMGLRPAQTCCHSSPFHCSLPASFPSLLPSLLPRPPSLPPSFPPFPPSLHPPPLFLGLAWFAPPCLCSYCKFLQHQQCLFHRHTFCGGAGEVPSGRPRTFCGGRGGTRWPPPNLLWGGRGSTQWRPPCLLRGAGRYPVAAPPPSVGGSGGREGCREGAMEKGNCDSKFVLVAAPFTNPKGHIFVPWGLRVGLRPAQTCCHNIPFHCSLPLSLRPSLPPCHR